MKSGRQILRDFLFLCFKNTHGNSVCKLALTLNEFTVLIPRRLGEHLGRIVLVYDMTNPMSVCILLGNLHLYGVSFGVILFTDTDGDQMLCDFTNFLCPGLRCHNLTMMNQMSDLIAKQCLSRLSCLAQLSIHCHDYSFHYGRQSVCGQRPAMKTTG